MTLGFTSEYFDLWVYRRAARGTEYLLLQTSEEKAEKFFGGGGFWQIPTGAVTAGEGIAHACRRLLDTLGVTPGGIWSADFVYTIYNPRYDAVCTIPVFAAETARADIRLDWEHRTHGWYDADDCRERLLFRGLKQGLAAVRESITECAAPSPALRLP